MIYIYPNTLSTFQGDRNIALSNGYIEIDDATYADLAEGKKKWQNGAIVDDLAYEERKTQEEAEKERLEGIAVRKNWFDNDYRQYNEKLTRFAALQIVESIVDGIRGKTYTNLNDLYVEAEIVRAEIHALEA